MNADGTLDTAFVPGAFVSPSPGALALQPDGKLLACASTIVGVATKFIIVRLNGSGGSPPPPRIGRATLSPGGAVQFQVSDATTVIIQSSANLTNWTSVSTNTVSAGSVSFTDALAPLSRASFYRLILVP
jgi:hypothetical protein